MRSWFSSFISFIFTDNQTFTKLRNSKTPDFRLIFAPFFEPFSFFFTRKNALFLPLFLNKRPLFLNKRPLFLNKRPLLRNNPALLQEGGCQPMIHHSSGGASP